MCIANYSVNNLCQPDSVLVISKEESTIKHSNKTMDKDFNPVVPEVVPGTRIAIKNKY